MAVTCIVIGFAIIGIRAVVIGVRLLQLNIGLALLLILVEVIRIFNTLCCKTCFLLKLV